MSTPADLLVSGGEVLTPAGELARADVLVLGGTIAAVGEVEAPARIPTLDAAGALVVPGLVNAHTHSGENYNPGLYENLPLDLWFVHSHQVTREEPPSADAIYVRTMLGALQMLVTGTTCAVDFLYEAPEITLGTLEPVVRAYRDAGLRATIVLGVADLPFLASLPLEHAERRGMPEEAPPPSLDEILEVAEAAVERWHEPGGLIQIGLGPSAPQRCSEELLQATMELAEARELVWHTHVLETRTQAYTALRRHGRSFVEVLADRGLLGGRTTLVHAVWLTDRDVEILADTGTGVVHCLLSNLRLGDGIARLPALLRAGVPVALGTDGRGCDETLDMLELAKTTALVHKARGEHHADWPTALRVLELATVEGSRAAGHGERIGRIEPGRAGDLVLLERRSLTFTPLHDPVRQLVYGAASRDVRAVVVAGRVVVAGGRPTGVDLGAVLERAERHAAEAVSPDGDEARLRRFEAVVGALWERAERADVGVAAYIPEPPIPRGGRPWS